jgi:hypothetical protein
MRCLEAIDLRTAGKYGGSIGAGARRSNVEQIVFQTFRAIPHHMVDSHTLQLEDL